MRMIETEAANAMKANTASGNVYIIHTNNKSDTFQINQQQQPIGTDKYENAHTQAVAIEFWKRRVHEPYTLRMFCRLKV